MNSFPVSLYYSYIQWFIKSLANTIVKRHCICMHVVHD